jgi:hypothetical protein
MQALITINKLLVQRANLMELANNVEVQGKV